MVVYGLTTSIKCHTMVVTGTGKRSTHHVNGARESDGNWIAVEKEKKGVLKNLSRLVYLR